MEAVFAPPQLDALEVDALALIDELRLDLTRQVAEPRRWRGTLRRMAFARAVQASNSIEGYDASLDDVGAAVDDEPTLSADEETRQALTGYRDAMTYVLQVAQDEGATIDEGLLKALHFMMLKHDLSKSPGRWRPGYIAVRSEETGAVVYEGPDAEHVPALVEAMIEQLGDAAPPLVRGAMAHLNLVMIHPFRDGNGRMARCLQTLVLARDRILAPVFSSIEEYLGRNTQAYYDVLAEVGQGTWSPGNDARPWVRFCLEAHYRQAMTHLRRVQEIEQVWVECAQLAAARRLPDRAVGALADATMGFRLRNASYRRVIELTDGNEISELTASRDLKALVDAGLVDPIGERRGRYYVAAEPLTDVRAEIRRRRPARADAGLFAVAAQRRQLTLDTEA
jgi:Fic family protein